MKFGGVGENVVVDSWTRRRDFLAALGLISLGQDAEVGAVQTSQTVYGSAFYLYPSETITNICACVQTAASGTAPTGIYLGLWQDVSGTPTCVAASANLGSDSRWASQGWKVCALSSPYTPGAAGIFYAAYLINGSFGTTNLQLAVNGALGPVGGAIGASLRRFGSIAAGATAMAAANTGTYGQAGSVPQFALS
jgi:hypothetical protein